MPTLKRNVSKAEDRTPVGVYDGPAVPDGTYAGIIRSMKLRTAKTGTQGINTLVVLDSHNKDGQHSEYDGAPTWTKAWLDGSDFSQTKELALYKAVCGKGDVTINIDDKVQGDPIVTKVGGVNPVGTRVYVELRTEPGDDRYGPQQQGFMIYPDPKNNGKAAAADEAEEDEPEGEEEVVAEKPAKKAAAKRAPAKKAATVTPINKNAEPEAEESEDDFDSMTVPQLRAKARELGLDPAGRSKKDLIQDLKDQTADTRDDGDNVPNPKTIEKMDEDALLEFLKPRYEEVEDFYNNGELIPREDIVQILAEDGHITQF